MCFLKLCVGSWLSKARISGKNDVEYLALINCAQTHFDFMQNRFSHFRVRCECHTKKLSNKLRAFDFAFTRWRWRCYESNLLCSCLLRINQAHRRFLIYSILRFLTFCITFFWKLFVRLWFYTSSLCSRNFSSYVKIIFRKNNRLFICHARLTFNEESMSQR